MRISIYPTLLILQHNTLPLQVPLILILKDSRLLYPIHILMPIVLPKRDRIQQGSLLSEEPLCTEREHIVLNERRLDVRVEQDIEDDLLLHEFKV